MWKSSLPRYGPEGEALEFRSKHQRILKRDAFEPLCESYYDKDDLEVRFTVPYDASSLFEIEQDPAGEEPRDARRERVKRNAPCPCGSGRKYKKCHLLRDTKERPARAEANPAHDLDSRVAERLLEFTLTRYGSEWRRHMRDFTDAKGAQQLSVPWSLYCFRIRGATVVDRYLDERG